LKDFDMSNTYPGSPVRTGQSGETVGKIQAQLAKFRVTERAGLQPLKIDREFGPSTETAVRLFQAQSTDPTGHTLDVDGVVGPLTWAALFDEKVDTVATASNDLLSEVLKVASAEVGVREQPLGSNRGPRVDEYLRRVGLDPANGSYAWCAAFTYYCFDVAADNLRCANPSPRTAGVLDLWNKVGNEGFYRLSPALANARPELVQPGMLFFLSTGAGTGHLGLIKSVTGANLVTIEGNTTDITGSREGIGVF
jgi:hypothetical protein